MTSKLLVTRRAASQAPRPSLSRRAFAWALLAVILLVPGAQAASQAKTTSQTLSFFSKALDRQTTYVAFVPTPFEPGRRYPVVYLLHGAYGSYRDWPKVALDEFLAGRPMIVVTPDGGEFGWYVDSPLKPHSNYESFLTRDLVAEVDARFPTLARREGRALWASAWAATAPCIWPRATPSSTARPRR
jgi:S-formylglutathione hydrolase FrmB